MQNCPYCSAEISSNAKFCDKCGKDISGSKNKKIFAKYLENKTPKERYNINIAVRCALPTIISILCIVCLFMCKFEGFFMWVIMAVIAAIYAIFGFIQLNNTCKKCYAWNALEKIQQTETGRNRIIKTETRTTKHYKGRYASYDNRVGVSETKVDVPYLRVNYHCVYKCKKCGELQERNEYQDVRI